MFVAHVALPEKRLDWQMWFAALGTPQSSLWFLNLVKKLLDNCGPVQHLVGDSVLRDKNLVKVRAKLYHYDFTRFDTEWNRDIPGAWVISNATDWIPTQYWNRRFVRMYLGEPPRTIKVWNNDCRPMDTPLFARSTCVAPSAATLPRAFVTGISTSFRYSYC